MTKAVGVALLTGLMVLGVSACGREEAAPSAPDVSVEAPDPEADVVADVESPATTNAPRDRKPSRPAPVARDASPSVDRVPAPPPEPRRPRGTEQTLRGLEQRMLEGFDRLDFDGDGQLTPDELAAGDGPEGARLLRSADEDGNGVLTRSEIRLAAARLFAMMDVNGDGVVTEDERPR